jgi:hypothetical protein
MSVRGGGGYFHPATAGQESGGLNGDDVTDGG